MCLAAALCFGAATPAAARLADRLGAFSLAGLLYLGAAVAVAPMAQRRRPDRAAIRRALPALGAAVLLGGAVGPVLLALALAHAPSASVSLLLNLELVFTGLLAVLLFGEHLGRWVGGGTLLVVAAGVVLGWGGAGAFRWSTLFVVGACLCWSIDNTVTANLDQLSPTQITLAKGVGAGVVNFGIGVTTVGWPASSDAVTALAIGAIGYGASIPLWISGARELGAARGQLLFATAPFAGAVIAWTVFGDPVLPRQVIALALAMGGVALVLRSGHVHRHRHVELTHEHGHEHNDGHHDHPHQNDAPANDAPANDAPANDSGRHHHRHVHAALEHEHGHVSDPHHRHGH